MKRLIVAFAVVGMAALTFAEDAKPKIIREETVVGPDGKTRVVKKIDRARLDAAMYRQNGGKLKQKGVQKGKLVYVNCQKEASAALVKEHADFFAKQLKIEIETVEGSFELAAPRVQGDASLFIVDDPKLPMSLVAPEARWGVVNVAPLKCEKPQFFEARVKKELSRGFSFLAGAVASQYEGAITEGITKPEELDTYAHVELPYDIVKRMPTYLKGYGIVPYKLTTYRKACEEGWAPEPTNDVQKAIWTDVHKLPDKPIKIEYNDKKAK